MQRKVLVTLPDGRLAERYVDRGKGHAIVRGVPLCDQDGHTGGRLIGAGSVPPMMGGHGKLSQKSQQSQ